LNFLPKNENVNVQKNKFIILILSDYPGNKNSDMGEGSNKKGFPKRGSLFENFLSDL